MARDYNSAEFQKFLDEQQYSRNGILRYEKIFGEDFVSTGGITTTKVRFDLKNFCWNNWTFIQSAKVNDPRS